MHALYAVLILLTLLLFISVPLVCPFHLYLNYSGGDAAVYLRLLFLKIDLYRKDKDKKDGEKQDCLISLVVQSGKNLRTAL